MTGKMLDFWMVMIPFLLSPPEVCSAVFERSMCLEVAEEFISKENPCKIQLGYVKEWFKERSGTSVCGSQTFCIIFFSYDSDDKDSKYYQFNEARATIINRLDGESTTMTLSPGCTKNSNRKRTLYIDVYGGCIDDKECGGSEKCSMYNYGTLNRIGTCVCINDTVRINGVCRKVDVEFGESCNEDIQCSKAGYNRFCDNSTSTCLCVHGFTEVNDHCINTDLQVNQTCWFDEQCNGTVNSSVCKGNMCTCMAEHYYADGTCQPTIKELQGVNMETLQCQQQLQENKESNIAQIVAAVIGGFVSGILTCFAAVYVLKIRNKRSKQDRKTEVKFVNNISYEKEISANVQTDSGNLEQTKISHVRHIINWNPQYSNSSQAKAESNDIYNHLNEKMEDGTDMDDYDRALPVTEGMSHDEEYSNLRRCTMQSDRLQTEIDAQDDYAVAKIPGDVDVYSSLERQ